MHVEHERDPGFVLFARGMSLLHIVLALSYVKALDLWVWGVCSMLRLVSWSSQPLVTYAART